MSSSLPVIPVILSGGSGTRLWPMSRKAYPKQLLAITGSKYTMLQETARRVRSLGAPIVVANEDHRFLVAEQMQALGGKKATLLLEPAAKNTAPAIALAACAALSQHPDAVLVVLPADHLIKDQKAFLSALKLAVAAAREDHLVTFGVVPTHPETGYGYIKAGSARKQAVRPIERFIEKPDLPTARRYLKSGQYFWNSGMFVFKASIYMKELETFNRSIAACSQLAFERAQLDLDFIRADKGAFSKSPEDSIDYAVMEKTTRAAMVPLSAGWSDLGSWSSVWQEMEKDKSGNVVHGDVVATDCKNSLFFADHHLIAAVGVEDLVVVDTSDALLITRQDRVQDVKKIVDRIKTGKRSEHLIHRKVYRPWGSYEGIGDGSRYQVKRIIVKPGASLSLQMHHHRAEHWIVVVGTALVQRGDDQCLLRENESIYIPLGEKHRLSNPGSEPLELIEVQSGGYLGEDDIVRFEDHYGRHK